MVSSFIHKGSLDHKPYCICKTVVSLSLSALFFYFLNFWLRWVFVAAQGLSLVAASGGHSSLRCMGFSLRWLLLLWSTGSRCAGFTSCSTWAPRLWLVGSSAQAQQLWHTGLAAPWHVGSSRTRDQTCVPCIGRQVLNHCSTREVHPFCFKSQCLLFFLTNNAFLFCFVLFFVLPEQGTYVCIKNLFRQISFLLHDFLNGIWEAVCCLLVGRSCFCCHPDIF